MLLSGKVLKSSAAPFQDTCMPMQNNKKADSRTTMVVPVTPIHCASRAELQDLERPEFVTWGHVLCR